jgi:hypothetical protein
MIEAQLAKQVGAQSPLPHSRTGPPLTLPAGGRGIEVPGPSDGST